MIESMSGVRLRPGPAAAFIDAVHATGAGPAVTALVEACLHRTPEQAFLPQPDGTTAVVTGDIPAVWLRDASIQAATYLPLAAQDPDLADVVGGVLARLLRHVVHDPYANAFNLAPDGAHHDPDDLCRDPWVWEQKYEIDSAAHVLRLAAAWWRETGRPEPLREHRRAAVLAILDVVERERDHTRPAYRFRRADAPAIDTLACGGLGTPVAPTGLSWSGFRPSDDACTLHYTAAGNLFAAAALRGAAALATVVWEDHSLARRCTAVAAGLHDAVLRHAVVDTPDHGRVLAYEVDGLGRHVLMDDPNVPSLVSLPLLGALDADSPLYRATRTLVLGPANPYWYAGRVAAGQGSPHTWPGYVWPIGLIAAARTGTADDRLACLRLLARTDAGTGHVHESFHADDPARFTRAWFSWGDCALVELARDVVSDHRGTA